MESIYVLIKPASGNCNMVCDYCFYSNIMNSRDVKSYGFMSLDTLENIIKKALQDAENNCTFAFQGGEPTLVGLGFYEHLMTFQKRFNKNKVEIRNVIQTNGFLINEEWAKFLTKNNFLVGVSVDGTKRIHDSLRKDHHNKGTYNRIKNSTLIFDQCNTEYNILTVVTPQIASNSRAIYNQYKKNGWHYVQFIPCIDPIGKPRGSLSYSLTPEMYGKFLMNLFDTWFEDISSGDYVFIRYFDNLIRILLGYRAESCGLNGVCSRHYVIEADGGVYPCDFYVTDQYRLGNINTGDFNYFDTSQEAIGFIEKSFVMDKECLKCEWYLLCKGGCRRDRDTPMGLKRNYFCESFKKFFPYVIYRLGLLARRIS